MRQIVTIEFQLPKDVLSSASEVMKMQEAMNQIESIAKASGATVAVSSKGYVRTRKDKTTPAIPGADPKYASPMSDANLQHEDQPAE